MEKKDLTIGNSMKILDVMEILIQASIEQNNGLLNSRLGYAVKKVKDSIGQLIYKRKDFLDNFNKYIKYQDEVNKRTGQYQKDFEIIQEKYTKKDKDGTETKINNEKIQKEVEPIRIKYTEDLQKIDENYKEVIEKHRKFLNEKLKMTNDFYKIKIDLIPSFSDNSIIEFLEDYNLIIE